MAKNKNRRDLQAAVKKTDSTAALGGVSKRGWKVIAAGIGIAAAGYVVLSFTDPAGQNWASNLCPFLILGGYATIGVGIILPDPGENPAGQNADSAP